MDGNSLTVCGTWRPILRGFFVERAERPVAAVASLPLGVGPRNRNGDSRVMGELDSKLRILWDRLKLRDCAIIIYLTLTVLVVCVVTYPVWGPVTHDMRACRQQFSIDLKELESVLLVGDLESAYSLTSTDFQQAVGLDTFIRARELLVPTGAFRLRSAGDYSLTGLQACWVDASGQTILSDLLVFKWQQGKNRLYKVRNRLGG